MNTVIQFSKNDIRNPENPPVAFAFEGVPVPDVEGEVVAPQSNTGDKNIYNTARAARKVRKAHPEAFEDFEVVVEEWKDAKQHLRSLKEKLSSLPSEMDLRVQARQGEIDDISTALQEVEDLKAAAKEAEVDVQIAYATFAAMSEASNKALKALNASLAQEAKKRAKKAEAQAEEVLQAAEAFVEAAEAFHNHGADELTTAVSSTMPIDTKGSKYLSQAKNTVAMEMERFNKLKEVYNVN